ncbi:MAG: tetratricopeptide repeat protein [Opitutales bacterium]|nr:tetratricopeptide repeat protein [Opitutales bacterium]
MRRCYYLTKILSVLLLVGFGSNCSKSSKINVEALNFSKINLEALSPTVAKAWTDYYSILSSDRNLESLALTAQFLHANDLYIQASTAYEELIIQQPENEKWHYLLARIRQDYGDTSGTLKHLQSVLQIDPSNAFAHLRIADVLYKTGVIEEALKHYKQASEAPLTSAHALLGIARIQIDENKLDQAIDSLEKAIKINPNLSTAHSLLASTYESTGDLSSAEKALSRAQTTGRFLEPEDPWLDELNQHCFDLYKLQVTADKYFLAGYPEKAIQILKHSLSVAPDDAQTMRDLAFAYFEMNQDEEGIPLVRKSISIEPTNPDGYTALITVLSEKKLWKEANQVVQDALKSIPNNVDIFQSAGIVYEGLKDYPNAELQYLKALRVDPDDQRSNLLIGKFYFSQEKPKTALPYLEKSRALKVTDSESRMILAKYYLSIADLRKAEPVVEELQAVTPTPADFEQEVMFFFFVQRGNQALTAQNTSEAERNYIQALKIDKTHIGARTNLIKCYLDSGRSKKAVETTRLGLEIAKKRSDIKAEEYFANLLRQLET